MASLLASCCALVLKRIYWRSSSPLVLRQASKASASALDLGGKEEEDAGRPEVGRAFLDATPWRPHPRPPCSAARLMDLGPGPDLKSTSTPHELQVSFRKTERVAM